MALFGEAEGGAARALAEGATESEPQAAPLVVNAPWSLISQAVSLASLAYGDNSSADLVSLKTSLAALGLRVYNENSRFITPTFTALGLTITGSSAFAAIDDTNHRIIIAFRGSVSGEDFWTDYAFVLNSLLSNIGPGESTTVIEAFSQDFAPWVAAVIGDYQGYDIVFTGHSLGGMVAETFTHWYQDNSIRPGGIDIFGVAVGSPGVSEGYADARVGEFFHITREEDRVGTFELGEHIGPTLFLEDRAIGPDLIPGIGPGHSHTRYSFQIEWLATSDLSPYISFADSVRYLQDDVDNTEFASSAYDVIIGGRHADVIFASGVSALWAEGAEGADGLHGSDFDDLLSGGAGDDHLYGGAAADLLWGGDGGDELYGSTGGDTLNGGGGNDVLEGGLGRDELNGGDGEQDTAIFTSAVQFYRVSQTTTPGVVAVQNTYTGEVDFLTGVERLVFSDASGLIGDFVLAGPPVTPPSPVLPGPSAPAVGAPEGGFDFIGSSATDIRAGGGGGDKIDGRSGWDVLNGGDGSDVLLGGSGGTWTLGGGSSPLTEGDELRGGDGDDLLIDDDQGPTRDTDYLDGGAGDDRIVFYGPRTGGADQGDGGLGEDLVLVDLSTRSGEWAAYSTGSAFVVAVQDSSGSSVSVRNFETHAILFGSGNDSAQSNGSNTYFDGGAGADNLNGGAGIDVLKGGEGNDTLVATGGADWLDGGAGTDAVYLELEAETRSVTADLASMVSAAGLTLVDGKHVRNVEVFELRTGSGADTLTIALPNLTGNTNLWVAGAGQDRLIADFSTSTTVVEVTASYIGTDYNAVTGYARRLNLNNVDAMSVIGGTANDYMYGTAGGDTFEGRAGDDALDGGVGDDLLDGGAGADNLNGGAGIDVLKGGEGNDTLVATGGADWLDGGAGTDAVYLELEAETRSVTADLASMVSAAGLTLVDGKHVRNVEVFELRTGSGADTLTIALPNLTGNTNLWVAGAGQDRLIADFSTSTTVVEVTASYIGTDYNAVTGYARRLNLNNVDAMSVIGGTANDYMYGTAGGDTFEGRAGDDALDGGVGDDLLDGGAGADNLNGGAGIDVLKGGEGNDTLVATGGADWLDGGAGTDAVYLELEAETRSVTADLASMVSAAGLTLVDGKHVRNVEVFELRTGSGADTLTIALPNLTGNTNLWVAGAGQDRLIADFSTSTTVVEVTASYIGTDYNAVTGYARRLNLNNVDAMSVIGGTANDYMYGTAGGDTFEGRAGDDALDGGVGDDLLDGGAGADDLYGGAGADVLKGGTGNDVLGGGLGADSIIAEVGGGADTVTDFVVGTDKIDVSAFAGFQSVVQSGADALITVAPGVTIRLTGITASTVTDASFIGLSPPPGTEPFAPEPVVTYANVITAAGQATVNGTNANDDMTGTSGVETLSGGGGADRLAGGLGNDKLIGGGLADIFVFGPNGGNDIVQDFQNGIDLIDARGAGGHVSIVQQGTGTLITFADGSTALLRNTTATDISNADFIGAASSPPPPPPSPPPPPPPGTEPFAPEPVVTYANVITAAGQATVNGTNANDDMTGTSGVETLSGGGGADRLAGGLGNDKLIGGGLADIFVFGPNGGNDIVQDFQNGIDLIDARGAGGHVSIVQQGTGTLITFADGSTALLRNTTATDISNADFIGAASSPPPPPPSPPPPPPPGRSRSRQSRW